MSDKTLHTVYKAASQITVHRFATAVGNAGKSLPAKASESAAVATSPKKSSKQGD